MNAYIPTMIVAGLYLAGVFLVLLIGRLIIGTDLYRRWAAERDMRYPRSRIVEDLRPVQETMIDFIDASPPSRELLQRLAETDEPIRIRKLLASVPAAETSWTALLLIAVAGLVTFGRHGVFLTEVGREVLARLNGRVSETAKATVHSEETVAKESFPTCEGKNGSDGASHLQLVREALDRNERARFSEPPRVIRGFKPGELRGQPVALPASDPHAKTNPEKSSPAIVTSADHRELTDAIVAARKLASPEPETQVLQQKLAHAVIHSGGDLPADLITLYSRAELVDVETDEQLNLMLVFPIDANLEEGRVSVFDPLGAAMLGRRVGDQLDWGVPYGVRRFEVKAVDFQPEAILAQAA